MRPGIHMPQKGGFAKNVKRAAGLSCCSVQIFLGNPTGWRMGKLDKQEVEKRVALLEVEDLKPLVVHSAYLINLASNNGEFLQKSKQLLDETMERAALYRSPYVVLHTGNHGGEGKEKGLAQIIEVIGEGLKRWPREVQLLLENTAGSGTALGADFTELGEIINTFPEGKLGVCIDTAHGWAAGYDFSTPSGVEETLQELDRAVGLEQLKVLHLNDTKVERGSRVDRHAHLGEGNLSLEGLRALFHQGWPAELPVILETPENGTERDRGNLEKLFKLIGNEVN